MGISELINHSIQEATGEKLTKIREHSYSKLDHFSSLNLFAHLKNGEKYLHTSQGDWEDNRYEKSGHYQKMLTDSEFILPVSLLRDTSQLQYF